jgi:hypothetical protein
MVRETAGALSLKAASDKTKYDPAEAGEAQCISIIPEAYRVAREKRNTFDEPEYFSVILFAGDPLIEGVQRHKPYAYLFLPAPRPQQIVFLYNKSKDSLKRIWSLPHWSLMEVMYLNPIPPSEILKSNWPLDIWSQNRKWVRAFYDGCFWPYIRRENNFDHLSEIEYLKANRQKLLDAGAKECESPIPEPFDFSQIKIDHIVDTKTARVD